MCTTAASQLCCLAAVVGLPTFCCGVCRCRAPRECRSKLCAGILAQALARCPAQVLQPIRHGFHRDIPNWTTSCDHTKSRHGGAHCPSQRSRPSRHVFMLLAKRNWSASLWWTQHLRSLANMSGENSVPKMSARVNVTSENALLPLWSDCPHRPSSTGAGPTMLQATWREQAHRARTPLRLTCFAAALTGPRGPSLVISFSAGHGTRVMSRRNVSAHHLRQFAPHSNNSVK